MAFAQACDALCSLLSNCFFPYGSFLWSINIGNLYIFKSPVILLRVEMIPCCISFSLKPEAFCLWIFCLPSTILSHSSHSVNSG
jgi:hypothetical protein